MTAHQIQLTRSENARRARSVARRHTAPGPPGEPDAQETLAAARAAVAAAERFLATTR